MSLWCCCCCEPEDPTHLPLLNTDKYKIHRRDRSNRAKFRNVRSYTEKSRNDGFQPIKPSKKYERVTDIKGAPTGKRWYHGRISHREAEQYLQSSEIPVEDGTYLVYDSPEKRGNYVLLVRYKQELLKWKITRSRSDGEYVLGEDVRDAKRHKSVSKLIKYHRGFTGKPIKLENGRSLTLQEFVYEEDGPI